MNDSRPIEPMSDSSFESSGTVRVVVGAFPVNAEILQSVFLSKDGSRTFNLGVTLQTRAEECRSTSLSRH